MPRAKQDGAPGDFLWTGKWLDDVPSFDQRVVVLPFYGEFGHYVMSYIPAFHALTAPYKIVCCHLGDECLFPSAQEFFYDWRNPFPDEQRACIRDRAPVEVPRQPTPEECELERTLSDVLPGASRFRLDWPLRMEYAVRSMPDVRIPNTDGFPKVDVVIGARRRLCPSNPNARVPLRNYAYWREITTGLRHRGFSIAQAGLADNSMELPVDVRAWDFANPRCASLGLISHCRLYIGTDSGTTHLAAVLGARMVTFRLDRSPNILASFTRIMARRRQSLFRIVENGWSDPGAVVSVAAEVLLSEHDCVSVPPMNTRTIRKPMTAKANER